MSVPAEPGSMVRALDGLFGDSECTQAVHELYAYLDHALPHQQWEQLEAHLSRCAPCVRAFAFEARLRVVIAQRCTESVPPALVRRVVVAVRREAGRH